jgi:hypothetical protein
VEVPRSLVDRESMPEEFQPATPKGLHPKWCYIWSVGPLPSNIHFKVVISHDPFSGMWSLNGLHGSDLTIYQCHILNSEPIILPKWKQTIPGVQKWFMQLRYTYNAQASSKLMFLVVYIWKLCVIRFSEVCSSYYSVGCCWRWLRFKLLVV